MTYSNTERQAATSQIIKDQDQLRHPNVMTEAERLALPDPCRPIDKRVIPARHTIDVYMQKPLSLPVADSNNNLAASVKDVAKPYPMRDNTTKILKKNLQSHQSEMLEQLLSEQSIEMRHFIQQQQQQANSSQSKHPSLHLPLSLLPRLVNDSSISLMKAVMGQYPHLASMDMLTTSLPKQTLQNSYEHQANDAASTQSDATYNQALLNIETKLYLMGQMYHLVLCVFLLCQCKSRKSLNPQITLQDLADAINQYIEAHRTQLHFLTRHNDLYIEPTHVALAALAMDWQVGKQTAISKRTITISSQNPITGG
ncbi:hypothetical protein [Moraxella osloensis]|uniref:hypothetical protein n=1 Tax=Faucicola osloensis TaxID=34062 RepID=UPI002431C794|nr:hypothetical protein [Moraxella osloensis]